MRILGVDPGQSIGLCLYDADQRRVLEASTVKQVADVVYDLWTCDVIVVERLVPHGASYPQVVDLSVGVAHFGGYGGTQPDGELWHIVGGGLINAGVKMVTKVVEAKISGKKVSAQH